jgi:acyl-CoA thioesterase FadM
MEQFFYTETMTVMNADADFRSLLKPSALLRYVEQISADHARAFGMDDQFFKDRGVTFLVGKQALKFDRVPQRAETLTLTSRAQVSKRGSVKRITTLTDAEGKEVAMVDCRWIVASLTEGRILREPGWTVENFWNDTVEGELPLQLHKCKDGLTSAGDGALFPVRSERPFEQRILSGPCLRCAAAGSDAQRPRDLCFHQLPPRDPDGRNGRGVLCPFGGWLVCDRKAQRPDQL